MKTSTKNPSRRGAPRARRRRGRIAWAVLVLALAAGVALVLASRPARGPAASRPFVGGDLHSLATDPSGATLFVGGHAGVASSPDGGRTWRRIATLDGADAMGWGFDSGKVLVGGHPGLHVSDNGGRSFARRNAGLPATDLHALGAGGGAVWAASPQAGVLVSFDRGSTWSIRAPRAGRSFMGRILVDAANPDALLATDMAAGVVESRDGGRTWASLGGPRGAMWITRDGRDAAHLVASGIHGAAESTDGGRTWRPLRVPGGATAVEMHPTDSSLLFAAGVDGEQANVWVSSDGGRRWVQTSEGR